MSMKTAISLPDDLFEAAEAAAQRAGLSRSQFYQLALRTQLAAEAASGVTERLNTVYGEDAPAGEGGLDPTVDALQRSSLEPEEW